MPTVAKRPMEEVGSECACSFANDVQINPLVMKIMLVTGLSVAGNIHYIHGARWTAT